MIFSNLGWSSVAMGLVLFALTPFLRKLIRAPETAK